MVHPLRINEDPVDRYRFGLVANQGPDFRLPLLPAPPVLVRAAGAASAANKTRKVELSGAGYGHCR